MKIYLDNASTTYPKPPAVANAVYDFMVNAGVNINRGSYGSAYSVVDAVYSTRQLLCELFQGEDCKNVVFTKNITESLNIVIKGLLNKGDHVLVSGMEHNAVMRPLQQIGQELKHECYGNASEYENRITFTRLSCNSKGELCSEAEWESYLLPNTKAIIITHASNVCGTVMPLEKLGQFCQSHQLLFIVDSAQTAGILPISMKQLHIDALCFTGHKGLLGPQGIGGFILKENIVGQIRPYITGGTGSLSHTEHTPDFMPDKFEAGTLNLPGILGLKAALEWLKEQGENKLYEHELQLTKGFLDGLLSLEAEGLLKIVGKATLENRTGTVSITTDKTDLAALAYELDKSYGICTRVGLHCAPHAHKALGTFPQGTVRFSFGWNNTLSEVKLALTALKEVLSHGL